MKVFSVLLAGGVSALFLSQGSSTLLQNHVKALQEAPGLTATLSVLPTGGAPATVKVSFAKPNLFKIESDESTIVSDGSTLFHYSKKDNSWTETPMSDAALLKEAASAKTWAWRAFFDKDFLKAVTGSKVGANRVVKGAQVTELVLTLDKGAGTLLIDPKLGIARGFLFKDSESDLLVTSTDIQLAKEALPASQFAFVAPAGAKKEEAPKPDEGASYVQVQAIMNRACMPCHNAQQRSGGHDFTNFAGVSNSVTPGNSANSELLRSVRGPMPRMPKFRPPLPARDVETITKWIDAGAKQQ